MCYDMRFATTKGVIAFFVSLSRCLCSGKTIAHKKLQPTLSHGTLYPSSICLYRNGKKYSSNSDDGKLTATDSGIKCASPSTCLSFRRNILKQFPFCSLSLILFSWRPTLLPKYVSMCVLFSFFSRFQYSSSHLATPNQFIEGEIYSMYSY